MVTNLTRLGVEPDLIGAIATGLIDPLGGDNVPLKTKIGGEDTDLRAIVDGGRVAIQNFTTVRISRGRSGDDRCTVCQLLGCCCDDDGVNGALGGHTGWDRDKVPLHIVVQHIKKVAEELDDGTGVRRTGIKFQEAILTHPDCGTLASVKVKGLGHGVEQVAGLGQLTFALAQRFGREPLIFPCFQPVPAVGEAVAHIVTPFAGPGAVGNLGA